MSSPPPALTTTRRAGKRWRPAESRKVVKRALLVAVVAVFATLGAQQHATQVPQPRVFAGVQPQLAKLGDRVFLTYGQDNVISILSSRDGGQTFASAVKLT